MTGLVVLLCIAVVVMAIIGKLKFDDMELEVSQQKLYIQTLQHQNDNLHERLKIHSEMLEILEKKK